MTDSPTPRRTLFASWTSSSLLCAVVACGGIARESAQDDDVNASTASSGDTLDGHSDTTKDSGEGTDTSQSSGDTTTDSSTSGQSSEDTGTTTGDTSSDEEDPFQPGPLCPLEEGPGELLTDLEATGAGPCKNVSLGSFLETLRGQYPEQSDAFWSGSHEGEPSDYYAPLLTAYLSEEGKFRVISAHGEGDCPSGCIEDYWTYFESDASCFPEQLGTVMRTFGDGCIEQEGQTRWGTPPTKVTDVICGEEVAQPELDGTYTVPFIGERNPCSTEGGATEQVSGELVLDVQLDPDDGDLLLIQLSSDDLELGWLDEQTFSLSKAGYLVSGEGMDSQTACIEEHSYNFWLDFASCEPSRLSYFEVLDEQCDGNYCKGNLELTLDLSDIGLTTK